MFRALRVRNYRLYASANLVSLTGTWMQRIGQDWLVLQLSDDSGVALGLITALQFGPTLLLSMYGGVLADRYDKRRMLLVTQALMGVLALGARRCSWPPASSSSGTSSCWPAALGAVAAVDAPVRQSFVSEMVGPELLANAVSLNSTIFNGARLVGPALAGLLIGASGGNTAPAFFVNAASFAFTIAALAVHADRRAAAQPAGRAGGRAAAGRAWPTPGRTPTWCWRWCWPSSSAPSGSTTRSRSR